MFVSTTAPRIIKTEKISLSKDKEIRIIDTKGLCARLRVLDGAVQVLGAKNADMADAYPLFPSDTLDFTGELFIAFSKDNESSIERAEIRVMYYDSI